MTLPALTKEQGTPSPPQLAATLAVVRVEEEGPIGLLIARQDSKPTLHQRPPLRNPLVVHPGGEAVGEVDSVETVLQGVEASLLQLGDSVSQTEQCKARNNRTTRVEKHSFLKISNYSNLI